MNMTNRGWLAAGAAALALSIPIDCAAGVNLTNGKWRDGALVWYYNGDQLPAGLTDPQMIGLATQAFAIWSAGCNISPRYGGTTTVKAENADAAAAGKVVVGFKHLPYLQGGSAAPLSADAQGRASYFSAGVVQIAADLTPYNLAPERVLAVLVHEVGHLLNLAHSDEPRSVMFANPYAAIASASKPYQLYGDDISTCANLYGGRGMQPTVDYATAPFAPDDRYRLSVGVGSIESNGGSSIAFGSAQDTWRPIDPGAVDLGGADYSPWMRVAWDNPIADSASVRIIAPTGDIVLDDWIVGTGPRGSIPRGYVPFRYNMWINGVWTVQVSVGGQPAAQIRFVGVNGVPSPPKLEVAAIAEDAGSGSMAFRIANYSGVGIATASAFLNNDYGAAVQRFTPAAGRNVIDLWAQSTLPRYRSDQACGQPGASSDLARQLAYAADGAGRIVSSAIDTADTGTSIAYSARGTIQANESGPVQVYVAAQVNGTLYFRQADGSWSTAQTPLFGFVAPGVASFDIMRDFDTRVLPPGTTLYVGYGETLDQMVANRRYKAVRTF